MNKFKFYVALLFLDKQTVEEIISETSWHSLSPI